MTQLLTGITNWWHGKQVLIDNPHAMLVLSVILISGFLFSRLAKKLKLPSITGQILAGVVLGHYVFNVFSEEAYQSFVPITNFALGFIGFTIGSHLDFRKLHNSGKRIISITIFDLLITPVLVYFALFYLAGLEKPISLLIAAISATTAPGSIIHIVREKRAKGMFTKTLLASVALNNVLVIMLFYFVYYYLYSMGVSNEVEHILYSIYKPAFLLFEAILIGGTVGFSLIYFTQKKMTSISFMTLVILAVVVTVGVSETLHFSGLLSSLILGVIISNFSGKKNNIFSAFKDIEREVFTLFFVLAGTHLDFKAMQVAGVAGIILIFSRFAGKYLGTTIGARLSNATKATKKNIGLAMHPIAGVAIGLVMLCENIPYIKNYALTIGKNTMPAPDLITAVVLTAVVVYELTGPILTGLALKKTGEEHKNRMRLMDFLQEEFIKVNIEATEKWEALEELAAFMHLTHHITELTVEELNEHIVQREKEISTGIGDGLAIPHAIIEGGPNIRGVIGVSKKGINFDAVDKAPVHILFLIATPQNSYELHLQMLANIAKIFGHHPYIKDRIIKASTAAAVFDILQTEEVEALNPFFED